MVVGTTSDSGKTVLAAGLCRHFARQGVKVAPFKAQNMSLNSGVTPEGGEMGRAQIVQAEAAGIEPHTDMNPVLLKPVGDAGSQVIVDGKAIGNFRAREYYRMKNEMKAAARAAFDRLSRGHDLVILEGAGSPAEINLMEEDFVNMSMAEYAGADVILVADIDRGGVFASILGTVALLPHRFRRLVKGIVINKFRGDESLLAPGIAEVEKITGIPVIGVLPYVHNLRIEDEDSMGLAGRMSAGDSIVDIAVVRFGRISNYTDFNSLENTDSVSVRFVDRPDEVGHPDLVILPGTKNTRADLQAIHESGMANAVKALAGSGVPVFGICGGYQMLGTRVADPNGVEGEPGEDKGLNLIAMDTVLAPSKELARVEGSIRAKLPFATAGTPFSGYEIHAGRSSVPGGHQAPLLLSSRRSSAVSEPAGSISDDGLVFGCYIHGFFDSPQLREQVLDWLCRRKNAAPRQWRNRPSNDFEGLADLVKSRLDLDRIR
jgi:adenosylcobyric acid synthase